MRLIAPAALSLAVLSLAACGGNEQAENLVNAEQGLTAESIVTNDVTAIDAVTGAAANMAADVEINFTNEVEEPSANGAARQPARQGATTPRPRPRDDAPTTAPASEPAENSTE